MKRTTQDAKWSKAIRERDGYTCRRCGKQHEKNSTGLHAAHIHSRGIVRIRHDLDNGMSLCYGCHRWYDSRSKEERAEFARSVIGNEKYDALLAKKNTPTRRVILTDLSTGAK